MYLYLAMWLLLIMHWTSPYSDPVTSPSLLTLAPPYKEHHQPEPRQCSNLLNLDLTVQEPSYPTPAVQTCPYWSTSEWFTSYWNAFLFISYFTEYTHLQNNMAMFSSKYFSMIPGQTPSLTVDIYTEKNPKGAWTYYLAKFRHKLHENFDREGKARVQNFTMQIPHCFLFWHNFASMPPLQLLPQ